MPLLSVIIPILNEEKLLEELHLRLVKVASQLDMETEFIFVNDGSSDGSADMLSGLAARDSRVKFICFTRNFGHQVAIQAGLEYAKGDLVVVMDGDLQDPPELIPAFINKLRETGSMVVYGKRKTRKSESFFKKSSAAFFYRLINTLSSIQIPLDTGDFRIMTAGVVHDLNRMKEPNKFLRGQVAWLGYKQASLEYEREAREQGSSRFSYGKMISFALDGITGFSNFPLKFATISGISISILSFIMIIYVLVAKFILHETISGWTSIMVAILFLGGIQLLSIGIIGEYISRINDSSRNRPLYIIDSTNIK